MADRRRWLPVFAAVWTAGAAGAAEFPPFNPRVGTQTFAPKYGFTADTRLVETAEAIRDMGSDTVKFALSDEAPADYGLPPLATATTLTALAQGDPSYAAVLAMPFRHYLIWTYPLTVPHAVHHPWRNGVTAVNASNEYAEVYDFARYLLREHSGSGKTFLLGHWEGDWALLGGFDPASNPSPVAIQGMVDWLTLRQQAVDAARQDEPHTNVFVWHYAEVNLLRKAMTGGVTVVNNVLTQCVVDLVSYSAYDVLNDVPAALTNALDYLAAHSRTTSNFHRDVFIGEYGFPLDQGFLTPQQQADAASAVMRAAAGWGCPFVLYWQMYDNEADEGGGNARGFWLVDTNQVKQPAWHEHRRFLGGAHALKNLYRFWLKRNPDEPALSYAAANGMTFLPSDVARDMVNSAEYDGLLDDASFLAWLFRRLGPGAPVLDPGWAPALADLAAGTSRWDVLVRTLDGPRFAAAWPDEVFADALFGGTWGRAVVDHDAAPFQAVLARLGSAEPRSALWREFLDAPEFTEAELALRTNDEVDARAVAAKVFFDPDRDADGLPDAWELQIIAASTNEHPLGLADVQPEGDADGDGLANADEHRSGTSPVLADSDGDGLTDNDEGGGFVFFDGLESATNLHALVNALVDHRGDGTVALCRTNASVAWTESIVDWQPGGEGGTLFSLGDQPQFALRLDGSEGGWCSVAFQFFTTDAVYIGEAPAWEGLGTAGLHRTNVQDVAAGAGLSTAAQYRVRIRLGPSDYDGAWPCVVLDSLAAGPLGATDPVRADSDGDGMGDGAERVAGTSATDAGSVWTVNLGPGGAPGGVLLEWFSATGRSYRVTRGSAGDDPGSVVLTNAMPADPPTNALPDLPGPDAAVYRISVWQ